MTLTPPADKAAYVRDIVGLLAKEHPTEPGVLNPSRTAAEALGQAWWHQARAETLVPPAGVSLTGWLAEPTIGDIAEPVSLRLVVGESRGVHRAERGDLPASDGLMTRAATSDGVAGAEAAVELVSRVRLAGGRCEFRGLVDEWPHAASEAKSANLLVVGSGEVNLFATFLHGVVPGLHLGHQCWPPQLASLGDSIRLLASGHWIPRLRTQDGRKLQHLGCVVLLQNPWNPNYRLLWVAGLTGKATSAGCGLAGAGWPDHPSIAAATGVVFQFDEEAGKPRPVAWLRQGEGGPTWHMESGTPGLVRPLGPLMNRRSGASAGPVTILEVMGVLPPAPRSALSSVYWAVTVKRLDPSTKFEDMYNFIKDAIQSGSECPGYEKADDMGELKTWERYVRRAAEEAVERFGEPIREQLAAWGVVHRSH